WLRQARNIRLQVPQPPTWPGPNCVHETVMRPFACLTMCLIPILANAAQGDDQAPSEPQAYCVNRSADFYPYMGETCNSGFHLAPGNRRKHDGRMMAVASDQCGAMSGTVKLPVEGGSRPLDGPQAPKSTKGMGIGLARPPLA